MSITPGTPDDLVEFWKPYDVPLTTAPRAIGDICPRCLTKHYTLECPAPISVQSTPPNQMPTDEPQEPQTATSDLPAPFSPWSRGFTYGDWPDLRDAVWEGDPADEAEKRSGGEVSE